MPVIFIPSAPCRPENPNVQLQCATNVAKVTWDNNGAEQLDMVTALNFTGEMTTCNSTNASCVFTQLRCGESYMLSVTGFTENCTSDPSTSISLNTGERKCTLDQNCVLGAVQLSSLGLYQKVCWLNNMANILVHQLSTILFMNLRKVVSSQILYLTVIQKLCDFPDEGK